MKSVYPADPKVAVKDQTYHKGCVKCATCNTQLAVGAFFVVNGMI